MRKILLLCFSCLMTFYSNAQDRVISGRVTSAEDGSSIPGVNVVVKGSTVGTVTDGDGNYSIGIPSNAAVLVFSFIGYATQEIGTGERTAINVQLQPDVKQLSEIVITGQGAGVAKARLSTTVDVVSSDNLKNVPMVRLDQMLQSQLPNTQINMSSGAPGTTSVIRSRGVSSALRSTTPVVYIDGVRVDNLNTASALSIASGGAQSSAISDIPVEDIDRIEFVKGGAATTLYGSDAANGVIQIFTKRGKAGQSRFTFETQLGSIQGTRDFFKFSETPDISFRNGFMQSYRLGFSGGNEAITYSFSGGIYDDNSFVIEDGLGQRRYNVRGSLNAKISNKANYSMSSAFTSSDFTRLQNANSGFDLLNAVDQGLYGDPTTWDEATRTTIEDRITSSTALSDFSESVIRFQNSHSFVYNPIDNVTVNATIGLDYRFSRQENITTNAYRIALGASPPGTTNQGTIARADRNFHTTTGSLNAQWNANLRDFSFITNIGGQFFRDNDKQTLNTAANVTEGSLSINNSGSRAATDFLSSLTNYGFYIAENAGYKDRYFLELGGRIDYNSTFGSEVGGQFFPKAGLSYVLSEESFMSGIENILSTAKLRVSYGEAGNFPPPFTRDRLVLVNSFLGGLAYQPGQPGDPNLKPERTKTLEVGTDLAFLKDRISIGFTYFNASTIDALFTAPFAPSSGEENQTRNLGEISNKGFELTTSFSVVSNQNWEVSLNASANGVKNKVVSSGGAPEFAIGGFAFLGSFVKEGKTVGYFRGTKPTFAEDGSIATLEQNADLGNPIPDVFGNAVLNVSFKKRVSLFVSGDYQLGAETVNTNEVLRYIRGIGDDRVPVAAQSANFTDLAGVWVEKGDYFKIRNITVSYELPTSFLGNKLKQASVSFSAINPFNFVSGDTIDPEITGAGAPGVLPGTNTATQQAITVGGFAYGTFSAPRQFIGTLRISL